MRPFNPIFETRQSGRSHEAAVDCNPRCKIFTEKREILFDSNIYACKFRVFTSKKDCSNKSECFTLLRGQEYFLRTALKPYNHK